jgi:hypothetical protein
MREQAANRVFVLEVNKRISCTDMDYDNLGKRGKGEFLNTSLQQFFKERNFYTRQVAERKKFSRILGDLR